MITKENTQRGSRSIAALIMLSLLWLTSERAGAEEDALATTLTPLARASTPGEIDYTKISLYDLMNIPIYSVSKQESSIARSPAAVYVIDQEDIRRSGARTIAEALRLAPGIHVAQISESTWAVSARGFNNRYAQQLLVLMDGRSLYTPVFTGVYWDIQDTLLEDVERIEVIRGPGGTIWGANAVNGVINIITKKADQTRGALVSAGFGSNSTRFASARYGRDIGSSSAYRVYAKYDSDSVSADRDFDIEPDDWERAIGGVRIDSALSGSSAISFIGSARYGSSGLAYRDLKLVDISTVPTGMPTPYDTAYIPTYGADVSAREVTNKSANAIIKYEKRLSRNHSYWAHIYYDWHSREEPSATHSVATSDIEFNMKNRYTEKNELIWGGGARSFEYDVEKTDRVSADPPSQRMNTINLFAQNETTIKENLLYFTIGSKIERNGYSDWELQPSARLLWTPTDWQSIWASISRAVRIPSPAERETETKLGPISIGMNRDFDSVELIATELGWRAQPSPKGSIDIALFHHIYKGARSFRPVEPGMSMGAYQECLKMAYGAKQADPSRDYGNVDCFLPYQFANGYDAVAYGIEPSVVFAPVDYWKLKANFSYTEIEYDRKDDGYLFIKREDELRDVGIDPVWNVGARSFLDLPHGAQFDLHFYYTSKIEGIDTYYNSGDIQSSQRAPRDIPARARLDVRLAWRVRPDIELSIVGRNIGAADRLEFIDFFDIAATEIPSSWSAKIVWGLF